MRKLFYVFIILLITGCSKGPSKRMENHTPDDYNTEIKIVESENTASNSIDYEVLTTDKLQEMYDLIALKHKHPEFEETITSQLKNYTLDSLIPSIETESSIKNVKRKSISLQMSDTIQKMKLYYDIVSESSTKPDSIWVEVTTNTLIVDGVTKKANKVKFRFD